MCLWLLNVCLLIFWGDQLQGLSQARAQSRARIQSVLPASEPWAGTFAEATKFGFCFLSPPGPSSRGSPSWAGMAWPCSQLGPPPLATGSPVYNSHKRVHFPSLALTRSRRSSELPTSLPPNPRGPFWKGAGGCPKEQNEEGLPRPDTALTERMGKRIKSAEKLIKQKSEQLHFSGIIAFSRFLIWYKPRPKWYYKLLISCLQMQFTPLPPSQASNFLASLSGPVSSPAGSWDPRLSPPSSIAPNTQHSNLFHPRVHGSSGLVWKPSYTLCARRTFGLSPWHFHLALSHTRLLA